jgi:hypothetical protein
VWPASTPALLHRCRSQPPPGLLVFAPPRPTSALPPTGSATAVFIDPDPHWMCSSSRRLHSPSTHAPLPVFGPCSLAQHNSRQPSVTRGGHLLRAAICDARRPIYSRRPSARLHTGPSAPVAHCDSGTTRLLVSPAQGPDAAHQT